MLKSTMEDLKLDFSKNINDIKQDINDYIAKCSKDIRCPEFIIVHNYKNGKSNIVILYNSDNILKPIIFKLTNDINEQNYTAYRLTKNGNWEYLNKKRISWNKLPLGKMPYDIYLAYESLYGSIV